MKFNNNTIVVGSTYNMLIDNTNGESSILVMTLQLTNGSNDDAKIIFRRSYTNNSNTSYYESDITIKNGTTILDHIIVIPAGQTYEVKSNSRNIIVSCSYAI